jgi:4-amino-4-deoxychorismate lyase
MKILTVNSKEFHHSQALNRGHVVFTSMRLNEGRILFLEDHIDRLISGADYLFPLAHWPKFKKELVEFLLSQEYPKNFDSYMRLTIVEDEVSVFLDKLSEAPAFLNLTDAVFRRSPSLIPSFLKQSNYLLADIEIKKVQSFGFDDVLFFDQNGILTESSTSNVFVVKDDGTIHTPKISSMVLDGVVRKNLIECLKENKWQIIEGDISRSDLLSAREIWLTNSIKGLRFINRWNEIKFNSSHSLYEKIVMIFGRYGELI